MKGWVSGKSSFIGCVLLLSIGFCSVGEDLFAIEQSTAPLVLKVLGNTPPGGAVTVARQDVYRRAFRVCRDQALRSRWTVEFTFEPGLKTSPASLVQAAAKSRAVAAVGFSYSKEAIPAALAAKSAALPVISPSASHSSLVNRPYFLSLAISGDKLAEIELGWVAKRMKPTQKIAILSSADEVVAVDHLNLLKDRLQAKKLEARGFLLLPQETDFGGKVVAKVKDFSPDLIWFTSFWKESAPILKAMNRLNIPVVGSHEWYYNREALAHMVGSNLTYHLASDLLGPGLTPSDKQHSVLKKSFETTYRKSFGVEPSPLAYGVCDIVRLIDNIMQNDKPSTREGFAKALHKDRSWLGVRGSYRIRNRVLEQSGFIVRVEGTKEYLVN